MKARVLAEGQFHGQIAEVIKQDKHGNYKLATKWNDDLPYPAWFSPNEVEIIEEQKQEEEAKHEPL